MLILIVASVFPLWFKDVGCKMKDWGSEGEINPFSEIYNVGLLLLIPHMFIMNFNNLACVPNDCPNGQLQRVI